MSQRDTSRAFTLIEMLLALTLTAVLLTVVSVTLGGVLRDGQRLEAMQAEPHWIEAAVHILRRDLRQAEAYRVSNGVILLHAHAGRSEAIDSHRHDPVIIEYEVLNPNEGGWLVRRVVDPTSSSTTQPTIELLGSGVENVRLETWVGAGEPTDHQPQPVPTRSADEEGMEPIPDQLTLTLTYRVSENADPSPHRNLNDTTQTLERLLVIR